MSRYVDADKFERACMFDKNCNDMQDVIYKLRDYPTADVRENVRGEWKFIEKSGIFGMYDCSNCGNLTIKNYNFCPNCGADMRGEA